MIVHYVVYKNPTDFPNEFVVRKWFIELSKSPKEHGSIRAGELVGRGKTYEEAIASIPDDKVGIGRMMLDDDPCIVNVFI